MGHFFQYLPSLLVVVAWFQFGDVTIAYGEGSKPCSAQILCRAGCYVTGENGKNCSCFCPPPCSGYIGKCGKCCSRGVDCCGSGTPVGTSGVRGATPAPAPGGHHSGLWDGGSGVRPLQQVGGGVRPGPTIMKPNANDGTTVKKTGEVNGSTKKN